MENGAQVAHCEPDGRVAPYRHLGVGQVRLYSNKVKDSKSKSKSKSQSIVLAFKSCAYMENGAHVGHCKPDGRVAPYRHLRVGQVCL
jgi:hypothetical protein